MKKFIRKIILRLFSFIFAFGIFMPMAKATGNVKIMYDPKKLSDYDFSYCLKRELFYVRVGFIELPQGEEYVEKVINSCLNQRDRVLIIVDFKGIDYKLRETEETNGRPIRLYYYY